MLDAIKFVKRATSATSNSETSHYILKDGTIKSTNFLFSMCHPIDLPVNALPDAKIFENAISKSDKEDLNFTFEYNRLTATSGKFKVNIPCLSNEPLTLEPEGGFFNLTDDFKLLPALEKLYPFIATDTHHAWAKGVLIHNQSMYATNSAILVEYWTGVHSPFTVNIPGPAVKELLAIGEEPVSLQLGRNTLTFHYGKDKWLMTYLYSVKWPDITDILHIDATNLTVLDDSFFDELKRMKPFTRENKVIIEGNQLKTENASTEINFNVPRCVFNINLLLETRSIIEKIDFTKYPEPCLFFGENIRGALMGIH